MLAYRLDQKPDSAANFAADTSDARMVAGMRLLLAVSAFLSVVIDNLDAGGIGFDKQLVLFGYIFHSLIIFISSCVSHPFTQGKLMHWLDVVWYAVIILMTGGVNSFFFLFFFFAILTSSFRWGIQEGARVTIASVGLFAACSIGAAIEEDLGRLLMRTTFLLSVGYMSVYWGGSKVELKHRLALLRDVSRFSNPRFGVGHTITSVLEKTLEFFEGTCCLWIIRDKKSGRYLLRTVKSGGAPRAISAEQITEEAAAPLLALPRDRMVIHTKSIFRFAGQWGGSRSFDTENHQWRREGAAASEQLAELLDTNGFISAPFSSGNGEGRVYVLEGNRSFHKTDALFLGHIIAQAFPVIENIELLDRMASKAALDERHKFALNLHDTAIQPYIGLKMALGALLKKATSGNPLNGDIRSLADMTAKVIDDLRRYAGDVKNDVAITEQILVKILSRQSERIRELYGIDIDVKVESDLSMGDRLTVEVLQIVKEGMSNICKHTDAQRGAVRLQHGQGRLSIRIENDSAGGAPTDFLPRSIGERAAALGGTTRVSRATDGNTTVHVEIPI